MSEGMACAGGWEMQWAGEGMRSERAGELRSPSSPLRVGSDEVVGLVLWLDVVVCLHVLLVLVGEAEVVEVLDLGEQGALQPA